MVPLESGKAACIAAITDDLVASIGRLTFSAPVTHTYHPLVYARRGYDRYVACFGNTVKAVVLVGMNPGPFGMAQTGVPFGDVEMVNGWMGINYLYCAAVRPPPQTADFGLFLYAQGGERPTAVGVGQTAVWDPGYFFQTVFRAQLLPVGIHGSERPKPHTGQTAGG